MENNKTNLKFTIMAVILITIFCAAIVPRTLQNDTFYTIKIGEHIMENGIDMKDPFSWHEDLDYTYPHWAYDVGTYFVYKLGGMERNLYCNNYSKHNIRLKHILYNLQKSTK